MSQENVELVRRSVDGCNRGDVVRGALAPTRRRAELRRMSGWRGSSEEELTEMEERVVRVAAEGRSNKEIAAELFVTVHTVGAHLSRAYRKVGVHSRTELAARLSSSAEKATKI